MMNPLSGANLTRQGYNLIGEDAQQILLARKDFARMLRLGTTKRIQATFTRRSRAMWALPLVGTRQQYLGLRQIPVCAIRGSENRTTDFDSEFYPLAEHLEERWSRVAAAFLKGHPFPPIDVIQVGDTYYVRDGHHRVSVARAFGQTHIDAIVTVQEEVCAC